MPATLVPASPAASPHAIAGEDAPMRKRRFAILCLASLGIVYGDIGTSPLYALRECFYGEHAVPPTPANVLGVLSLILWSLLLIISVKYLILILRADNRGEGGILALATLVSEVVRRGKFVFLLGLFGAALLYADGMITPAISVLGAVEGLHIATPLLDPFVVLIAVGILIGLFFFQSRGTTGVGKVFGPVTVLWFLAISALGVHQILRAPGVFAAINPWYGLEFFVNNGGRGFVVLGAVFLVVTGGEALYADIGHFGTAPIRLTWFVVVLPALVLNYFGQGALLFLEPEAAVNPFYRMVPGWALYPMVALATAAAVIASQAIISGAFSLTMQAIQLGYSPRLQVNYTSPSIIGQIYIPIVNWILMISCVGLVLGFRSSSNLAAAYGVAITTTMLITTILFYLVACRRWNWPAAIALPVAAFFVTIDLAFFGANMLKVAHGGWFPILVSGGILFLMLTWRKGRRILREHLGNVCVPLDDLLPDLMSQRIRRVPGTAIYMSGNRCGTPLALLHNLKHNKVLHEQVVLLTVRTEEVPYLTNEKDRVALEKLEGGFWRAQIHFGFMEKPDVPAALVRVRKKGELQLEPMRTTYFIGRETILATRKVGLSTWRGSLFAWMTRNAGDVTSYFCLPPNGVVELGARVEM
ncbi:MAG TPA: potassium transporter Kup [Chthoniobacterales bacterium]|jgi:KUP system potassium uptake protein|nr:potassium transporter Kup [Chthoniobacterales bacterium]